MRTRRRNAGSVLLMVIGLLTIIALLGASYVVVATMDRKASRSFAAIVPMESVGMSVVSQVVSERYKDLYLSSTGVVYGTAACAAQQIDFPHEGIDRMLSSYVPVALGTDPNYKWQHLTNLTGDANTSLFVKVDPNDPRLVDTDGFAERNPRWKTVAEPLGKLCYGDSRLVPSGIRDLYDREFYVAARVIDASGLLNVNTAFAPGVSQSGRVLPMSDISMTELDPGFATSYRDTIQQVRAGTAPNPTDIGAFNLGYIIRPLNPLAASGKFLPFDVGEQITLSYGGYDCNEVTGRFSAVFGAPYTAGRSVFGEIRRYTTTWSASRVLSRIRPGNLGQGAADPNGNMYRADLNNTGFLPLFQAFYNAIPAGYPSLATTDAIRCITAAQLAVNVIDYRDADANLTVWTVPGVPTARVCGIERQPFVTEVFHKRYRDPNRGPGTTAVRTCSAIELFYPYADAGGYNLAGTKLMQGAVEKSPSTGNWNNLTIPSMGRAVILGTTDFSGTPRDANIVIFNDPTVLRIVVPGLDTSQAIRIFRPTLYGQPGDANILLADVLPLGVADPANTADGNNANWGYRAWDDRLSFCRYTVEASNTVVSNPAGYDYTNVGFGNMTRANSKLGKVNDLAQFPTGTGPYPVYVRNGPFVNVGELSRVYFIGPSDSNDVRTKIDVVRRKAATDPAQPGRVDPCWDPNILPSLPQPIPRVPLWALVTDHLMVGSPMADGIDNDGGGIDFAAADPNNYEPIIYGAININTAPKEVLKCLPTMAGLKAIIPDDSNLLAQALINYREDPNSRNFPAFPLNLRRNPNDPNDFGFACTGETALPIWVTGSSVLSVSDRLPQINYSSGPSLNTPPLNYALTGGSDDDALSVAAGNRIDGDMVKKNVYYAWLSNQITVRSDVFIVYVRVQLVTGGNPRPTDPCRRYMAVIDRSRVRRPTIDRPAILMFAELK